MRIRSKYDIEHNGNSVHETESTDEKSGLNLNVDKKAETDELEPFLN